MHWLSLGWHLEGWGMSICNYMLRLWGPDLSPYRLVKLKVFKGKRPARTINISNNTADLFYFIAVLYLLQTYTGEPGKRHSLQCLSFILTIPGHPVFPLICQVQVWEPSRLLRSFELLIESSEQAECFFASTYFFIEIKKSCFPSPFTSSWKGKSAHTHKKEGIAYRALA